MSTARQQSLSEFVQEVRLFMRDYPQLNRLISGEETSDRTLAWAVLDALDDINNTPPMIKNWSVEDFPYRSLLLRGAVISALESVGLLYSRNQLNFSDGGISTGTADKAPMIMNWLNLFKSSYESKKTNWKIAKNIAGAFEGSAIVSDYYFLGGYYDSQSA